MDRPRVIIGFTGSFGSGCSSAVEYLSNPPFNFTKISLSEILEKFALERGEPFNTRKEKQDFGNKLRRENKQYDILAKQAATEIDKGENKDKNFVISSIRNPFEVEYFHKRYYDFYLFSIFASRDARWDRVKDKYNRNEALFDDDDIRDQGETDSWGQNVKKCVSLADVIVKNETPWSTALIKDTYFAQISDYIRLIHESDRAPKEHEVMMNFAYDLSLKSSCIQRQVGAVIAERERWNIIASGYNEPPKGSKPCYMEHKMCYRKLRREELISKRFSKMINYCPRCGKEVKFEKGEIVCREKGCEFNIVDLFSPGKELDYCRSLHAEENAIQQSGRIGSGVSLEGSIIYTTTFPCNLCAKLIAASGIKTVVYVEPYPVKEAREVLEKAGVEIREFEGIKAQAYYKLFKDRTKYLGKFNGKNIERE